MNRLTKIQIAVAFAGAASSFAAGTGLAAASHDAKEAVQALAYTEAAAMVAAHISGANTPGVVISRDRNEVPGFYSLTVVRADLPEPKFLRVNKDTGDLWLTVAASNCALVKPDAQARKKATELRRTLGDTAYKKLHARKPADCDEVDSYREFFI